LLWRVFDLTGKSTLIKKITNFFDEMQDINYLVTARPNKENKMCKMVYEEAKSPEYKEGTMSRYMLYATNNAMNYNGIVLPWIKRNPDGIVISDRCIISALAYNIMGSPIEKYIDSIFEIERACHENRFPNIVFYLYSKSQNLDPYNSLKNRANKLEPNDLKSKEEKIDLLNRYKKAINYYQHKTGLPVVYVDIDKKGFKNEVFHILYEGHF